MIHSEIPSLNDNLNKNTSTLNQFGGCQSCKRRCVLCKNYLYKHDKAYSHQTDQKNTKYKIKDISNCNSRNVIYIINDNVFKISSLGYTADNYETHLCEVSKHFSDNNLILYTLDKSSQLKYDNSLKEQIEVIIIEKGDVSEVGLTLKINSRKENCIGKRIKNPLDSLED